VIWSKDAAGVPGCGGAAVKRPRALLGQRDVFLEMVTIRACPVPE